MSSGPSRRRAPASGSSGKLIAAVAALAALYYFLWPDPGPVSNPSPAPAPTPEARSEVPAARMDWPPDGAPDRLAADPVRVNYYVVLDGSGSMAEAPCRGGGSKIGQARTALAHFAAAVPGDANLGLLVFDAHGIRELVPLGTDNRADFVALAGGIAPGGGTPLRAALAAGRAALGRQAQRQLGYGEYHLVVVTDGAASKGQDPRPEVADTLARTPIVLHTVGYCIGTNHALNQPGITVYTPANDLEELDRGLRAVLAEAPDFSAAAFTEAP